MKTIEENLAQYAAYHRDRRNIATHFAGVPMIVFAIILAAATMSITAGSMQITVAAIVSIAMCIYYFRLDFVFGLTMAVALFAMCAVASEMTARMSTAATAGWAIAVFAAGWALQFLGHKFEGMKPAFFDDARQLLIGPIFVCAEAYFLLGEKPQLKRYIEDRVGPTVARRDGHPLRGERESA
ncbi:MAG: Mpo1 family 2-hydroxy fatty acid dioxygenase [Usitatibacter sp.]